MIAATLVVWSVSIAFCHEQPIPAVCLNDLVRVNFIYHYDHATVDRSEAVMQREYWKGDCKDYAETFAALVRKEELGGPIVLSCRRPGKNGHRLVELDGVYYDASGGSRTLPYDWDCKEVE